MFGSPKMITIKTAWPYESGRRLAGLANAPEEVQKEHQAALKALEKTRWRARSGASVHRTLPCERCPARAGQGAIQSGAAPVGTVNGLT